MAKPPLNLSRRERQLIEALYRLDEASVAQTRAAIEDPPSYSSVRAMLTELVRKNHVTFRQDGKRYLYRPKAAREKVAIRMLRSLVMNFFRGRPSDAICALLEDSSNELSPADIERIKKQIEQAEQNDES